MRFANKTIFTLMVIFTILNLCDIVTTIFIFDGESNPLFNMVNNFGIMILFKLLIVAAIWIYALRNLYPTNMSYFMLLSILVYGCLALFLAQIVNINGIIHPEIVQAASQVSTAERGASYFRFMSFVYLIPIFITLLVFWVYERSRETAIIDKKIAMKNKWRVWKIQR